MHVSILELINHKIHIKMTYKFSFSSDFVFFASVFDMFFTTDWDLVWVVLMSLSFAMIVAAPKNR